MNEGKPEGSNVSMVNSWLLSDARQRRREVLRFEPHCRFVDRETFLRLALSNRHLVRADDSAASLRGLRDPATGITYLAAEEDLFFQHGVEDGC